jgi:hypothetical protein
MSSIKELVETISNENQQQVDNELNIWYNNLLVDYEELFGTSKSGHIIDIHDKNVAIVFFKECIKFWHEKKPKIKLEKTDDDNFIKFNNISDIAKIQICDMQINKLYGQLKSCNITVAELDLANFVK